MLKKALIPILLVLALAILLAGVMYGCLATDFEHKILGPEEHHH